MDKSYLIALVIMAFPLAIVFECICLMIDDWANNQDWDDKEDD